MQEPTEPNAFSSTRLADAIHPVVPVPRPHQRETVATNPQAAIQRSSTMFKQRCALGRFIRLEIRFALSFSQLVTIEKRHNFVQHTCVSGSLDKMDNGIRQPEPVIRDTCPHTPTCWRVPPMLDVAGGELAGSGPENLFPRNFTTNCAEGHDILELVAKPVSAA